MLGVTRDLPNVDEEVASERHLKRNNVQEHRRQLQLWPAHDLEQRDATQEDGEDKLVRNDEPANRCHFDHQGGQASTDHISEGQQKHTDCNRDFRDLLQDDHRIDVDCIDAGTLEQHSHDKHEHCSGSVLGVVEDCFDRWFLRLLAFELFLLRHDITPVLESVSVSVVDLDTRKLLQRFGVATLDLQEKRSVVLDDEEPQEF